MKTEFKPTAMRCTQKQFEEIRPELERIGCEMPSYISKNQFKNNSHLVNNEFGKIKKISIYSCDSINNYNRTVYEEWDKEIFLDNCGREVMEFEPLTRGGYEYNIIRRDRGDGCINVEALIGNIWVAYTSNADGVFYGATASELNLIPINPRRKELEARKAELETELEQIRERS